MPLTKLNIAVFAPMPSANVIIAMKEMPGRFSRLLIPNRMSLNNVSIEFIFTWFKHVA